MSLPPTHPPTSYILPPLYPLLCYIYILGSLSRIGLPLLLPRFVLSLSEMTLLIDQKTFMLQHSLLFFFLLLLLFIHSLLCTVYCVYRLDCITFELSRSSHPGAINSSLSRPQTHLAFLSPPPLFARSSKTNNALIVRSFVFFLLFHSPPNLPHTHTHANRKYCYWKEEEKKMKKKMFDL